MSAVTAAPHGPSVDESTYRRRIWAWTFYDWANSAFATSILAALLPVYYSGVAGATLPSEAVATGYWSISLSIGLFISAILSPILGTVSDVMRGKKRFLSMFIGIGVLSTGLLVFVNTGDWFLASMLFIIGRVGFNSANVFYDALLPHIAKEDDRDWVSTRGYAFGYLGGGILLAINVVMFLFIPDSLFENAGVRLSFLSVAVWWAVFSIPVLRSVPEPPSAEAELGPGETVLSVSWQRLRGTFAEVRKYRHLFSYLISFLIYNDGIGTIIGLAAIYGAELGFGTLELVLALLLVQFVGIPFSLIFGRLPVNSGDKRRHMYLAFILFNLVMLPLVGLAGARIMPPEVAGVVPQPFVTEGEYVGEGVYSIDAESFSADGTWETLTVQGEDLLPDGFMGSMTALLSGTPPDAPYAISENPGDALAFTVNGQTLRVTHDTGPDRGIIAVLADGEPVMQEVDGEMEPLQIDTYSPTPRYDVETEIMLDEAGQATVSFVNSGETNPESSGTTVALSSVEVRPPVRSSNLPLIIGILLGIQALGAVFAIVFGRFFKGLADTLDTRRSILLALLVYCVIATFGFVLNATIEFWMVAWMVAIVQGGSQALSRSLYSRLSPASKSGEFFGFFSIMEKAASILGPLIFALAVAIFGSSRPAILSLIALFVIGGYMLTRVDIEAGIAQAKAEDAEVFGTET